MGLKTCGDNKNVLKGLAFVLLFPVVIITVMVVMLRFGDLPGRGSGDESTVRDMFSDADHTVTFLDVNGEVYRVYTVSHGGCIGEKVDYSEEGYTFIGWDVPSYCNLDISEYPIVGDMTIKPSCVEHRILAINMLAALGDEYEDVSTEEMTEKIEEAKKRGKG